MSATVTLPWNTQGIDYIPPTREHTYAAGLLRPESRFDFIPSITLRDSSSMADEVHEILLDSEGIPLQGIVADQLRGESLSRLEDKIDEVFWECRSENWDGYGASPVTEETVRQAKKLVKSLPDTNPSPSIGADPDGEISFDWYVDPNWNLTLSIGGTGRVSFSGFFGEGRIRGIQSVRRGAARRISLELRSLFDNSFHK